MGYFFIVSAIVLRLIPHVPNFAPIAAMALFGGVYLNKKYALVVPLVALLISDYFIGIYNPWVMFSVYGSFLIIGLIGLWVRKNKKWYTILGGSLAGSILFYLVTNFAMWAVPHSLYSHSLSGLINCYVMGLPFFRNTLAGDLFYIGAMFGLMELAVIITNRNPLKKEKDVINRMERKRI